jgi:hypothetical protein
MKNLYNFNATHPKLWGRSYGTEAWIRTSEEINDLKVFESKIVKKSSPLTG